MDYEKKYKEALVDMQELYNSMKYMSSTDALHTTTALERAFPELKEDSEDERIRKWLIAQLELKSDINNPRDLELMILKTIAWLEKQGESKPTDIVEPKFHEGDWVVHTATGIAHQIKCPIENVTNKTYGYSLIDGGYISSVEEVNYHLWTIRDAKDGDVLFHSDSASKGIFIFKELLKYEFSEKVICYCDYDSEDHFCLGEHHTCCWADAKILHPATKEQRYLLFQKMKEAGYEWDIDKKELKKIDIITPLFNVGDTIIKKHNSDINKFGKFTITAIIDNKYWYRDKIICGIHEQDEWEIYEGTDLELQSHINEMNYEE